MFERFTEKARRVVFFARYEASQFGSPYIESEHLLLGLIRELKSGLDLFLPDLTMRAAIPSRIEGHTVLREKISTSVDLPLSNECKRVLAYAAEEADLLDHRQIGTEHLLLGLLREEGCFGAQVMRECGADLERARKALAEGEAEAEPKLKRFRSEAGSPRHELARELLEEAQQLLMSQPSTLEAFKGFTAGARTALLSARYEAAQNGSQSVENLHMLLGLLRQTRGDLYRFLPASISLDSIQAKIKTDAMMQPPVSAHASLGFSDECKQALAFADEEAARLGHDKTAVEHLLLGLLRVEDSAASKIMREHGADLDQLRQKLAGAAPPQSDAKS